MPTFSVRTIAEDCLAKPGELSLLGDIFSVENQTPPRSLRGALEFIHRTRCRPEAPSGLRVVEVVEKTVSLAWQDNADNETGFRIRFHGKKDLFKDHEGTRTLQGANRNSASLTDLFDGFEYTVSVMAFNNAGDSAASNAVRATTPIILEQEETIRLERQAPPLGPIFYTGVFPVLNLTRSGRVTHIQVSSGQPGNMQLRFTKQGRSTAECGDNNAVVVLGEGATSSPDQMKEIYGIAEPGFSPGRQVTFIACIGLDPPNTPAPTVVFIQIKIIFDS